MGRRKVRDLKRRPPVRSERHVIALYSEGEVTEPEYFRALAQLPEIRNFTKLSLRVELMGAVPLTLVQAAVEEQKLDSANEYWCVFDVEWPRHHPNLKQALELAERHGIKLAVSNPSFELWLVMHYRPHTAFLDNDGARRLRRELDGAQDKHVDAASYMPMRSLAVERAASLDAHHQKNGTQFPHNNPSSTAHLLVASIEKAPK